MLPWWWGDKKVTREEFQERHGIVGSSIEIREIVDVIQQVAPTDLTVLITGESGTGKEVIARAMHQASKRAGKAMVSVNAGAIPEGIIESELFGHEKGAFTGAGETRKGYFELADQGTIFLDEIGELPLATQVKFLRVLENGEYMRVGSAQPRTADVRVIAATNKDLEAEVYNGNFRSDLFFRLRSINIRIPPLRERREDVPLLVAEFARQVSRKHQIRFDGISDEAMEMLKSYDWPGNVRELRNVVESMLVVEQARLNPAHRTEAKHIDAGTMRKYLKEFHANGQNLLPVHTRKSPEQAERELIYRALLEMRNDILEIKQVLARQGRPGTEQSVPLEAHHVGTAHFVDAHVDPVHDERRDQILPIGEMQKRLIIEALERCGGNRRLAARMLNISERTMYRRLKEYGLL